MTYEEAWKLSLSVLRIGTRRHYVLLYLISFRNSLPIVIKWSSSNTKLDLQLPTIIPCFYLIFFPSVRAEVYLFQPCHDVEAGPNLVGIVIVLLLQAVAVVFDKTQQTLQLKDQYVWSDHNFNKGQIMYHRKIKTYTYIPMYCKNDILSYGR